MENVFNNSILSTRHIWLTSTFGNRTIHGAEQYHSGIDCVGISSEDKNTPIVCTVIAPCDCQFIESSRHKSAGKSVILKTFDEDNIYFFRYCHLSHCLKLPESTDIPAGQIIGFMGGSGAGSDNDYAIHLHFEMMKIPKNIFKTTLREMKYDGYFSFYPEYCIDPLEYGLQDYIIKGI